MLAYFPVVQKDELLASLLARFISRQGIKEDKSALSILFGSKSVVPSGLLQGRIAQLLSNVGHIWPISDAAVVQSHTILPIFRPFIPEERYKMLSNDLIQDGLNSGALRSGINASILRWPEFYKVCTSCWKEQNLQLGYSFWQRILQCPGVECCPKHYCQLIDTKVPIQSERRHQFVGVEKSTVDIETITEVEATSVQVKLSILTQQLLDDDSRRTISYGQWSCFYKSLAQKLDFLDNGRIDHRQIQAKVTSFWGDEWLENQGLAISGDVNWLKSMFRKHRRPFMYLQHFVVWLALDSKVNNLSDFLHDIGSITVENKGKHKYVPSTDDAKIKVKRFQWLKLMDGRSLQEIRVTREGARVYLWLYRYDRDWLATQKPEQKKNYINNRVNWQERDRLTVKRLLVLLHQYELNLDGPRRSRLWFCKKLSIQSWIEKKLDKLPLCRQFFIRYTETIDEYQARRLACVMTSLINNNDRKRAVFDIERIAGLSAQRSRKLAQEILRVDLPAWQIP